MINIIKFHNSHICIIKNRRIIIIAHINQFLEVELFDLSQVNEERLSSTPLTLKIEAVKKIRVTSDIMLILYVTCYFHVF